MATTGTPELLRRLRLAAQLIEPLPGRSDGQVPGGPSGRPPDVAEVVHHLLAIQAQDFDQAAWAVGLRAPGSTRTDVLAALERGSIVRSWPMRGTLHFVAPGDLRWMLRLTADRMIASAATRQRQLGLDQATLEQSADVARAVLSGGVGQSRAEFSRSLEASGIATTGQRGYHIIWYLAQTGVVCWGPPHGNQQALVLLDEWVPVARERERERDEALGEFVLRYFGGHGPATLRDFAWWAKVTMADARLGLAVAGNQLEELVCDGTSYWALSRALEAASASPDADRDAARDAARGRAVHALPGFDEYLLGYQDRSSALPPEHSDRIVPGNNGVFLPIAVSRGRVVGTWRRAIGRRDVTVTLSPFDQLSRREATAFARSADAYGRFVGLPVRP